MNPDRLALAVRALAFVCVLQSCGVAFYLALFGPHLQRTGPALRRLGSASAVAGVALLLLWQLLQVARMGGDFASLTDARLQSIAWHGRGGNEALFQLLGLSLLLFGLRQKCEPARAIASTGAAIVCCAFALAGHTSVHAQRALLAPLLMLHLLVVAFWFGALWPLVLTLRLESRQVSVAVLQGFSAAAGYLVPCILIAGLLMAWVLIPDAAGWHTPYASILLLKIGAFLLLLALAVWNRWRLVPALARARAGAPGALQRSIMFEYVLITAVLTMTAVLTTAYSP